ncbi:MAG: cellulose biosynthesis protein BcsN [Mesorhizobium sp.]
MNSNTAHGRQEGVRLTAHIKHPVIGFIGFAFAVFSLAGCASTDSIESSAVRKSASADQAYVFPPIGGPAIVGVIESKRSGGRYQEILLSTNAATSGQNRFEVTIGRNSAPVINPSPRIAAQMRAALPGVRMARSPYYVQNRYGPFGYAVGRSGARDLCLYGWQTIRAKATPMTKQGFIDVRLRLCETGATEQALLAVMYGYTIDAFLNGQGWNPYGDPLPPAAELGKRGADVLPVGSDQFATVVAPVPPSPRPALPRKARVEAAEIQAPVVAQPTGPAVPAPPADAKEISVSPAPPATTGPLVPLPPTEE